MLLPPGKCAPGFAKATIAYNMRICRLAKDDGYTVSPETDRRAPEMPESEGTLTLPSTPESIASSNKVPSKVSLFAFNITWPHRQDNYQLTYV